MWEVVGGSVPLRGLRYLAAASVKTRTRCPTPVATWKIWGKGKEGPFPAR